MVVLCVISFLRMVWLQGTTEGREEGGRGGREGGEGGSISMVVFEFPSLLDFLVACVCCRCNPLPARDRFAVDLPSIAGFHRAFHATSFLGETGIASQCG